LAARWARAKNVTGGRSIRSWVWRDGPDGVRGRGYIDGGDQGAGFTCCRGLGPVMAADAYVLAYQLPAT
jgi:hypothetical protein